MALFRGWLLHHMDKRQKKTKVFKLVGGYYTLYINCLRTKYCDNHLYQRGSIAQLEAHSLIVSRGMGFE
jgi:hypothetical protein